MENSFPKSPSFIFFLNYCNSIFFLFTVQEVVKIFPNYSILIFETVFLKCFQRLMVAIYLLKKSFRLKLDFLSKTFLQLIKIEILYCCLENSSSIKFFCFFQKVLNYLPCVLECKKKETYKKAPFCTHYENETYALFFIIKHSSLKY